MHMLSLVLLYSLLGRMKYVCCVENLCHILNLGSAVIPFSHISKHVLIVVDHRKVILEH